MKAILASLIVVSMFSIGCSHHGKKHSHSHHKKHWKMMDADKDGAVSKEEFDKYHSQKFDKMDSDKDGKVTKAEKRDYMKSKKKSCDQRKDKKKKAKMSK